MENQFNIIVLFIGLTFFVINARCFECSDKDELVLNPRSNNCDSYWLCENGRPSLITCPIGQRFHVIKMICVDESETDCLQMLLVPMHNRMKRAHKSGSSSSSSSSHESDHDKKSHYEKEDKEHDDHHEMSKYDEHKDHETNEEDHHDSKETHTDHKEIKKEYYHKEILPLPIPTQAGVGLIPGVLQGGFPRNGGFPRGRGAFGFGNGGGFGAGAGGGNAWTFVGQRNGGFPQNGGFAGGRNGGGGWQGGNGGNGGWQGRAPGWQLNIPPRDEGATARAGAGARSSTGGYGGGNDRREEVGGWDRGGGGPDRREESPAGGWGRGDSGNGGREESPSGGWGREETQRWGGGLITQGSPQNNRDTSADMSYPVNPSVPEYAPYTHKSDLYSTPYQFQNTQPRDFIVY